MSREVEIKKKRHIKARELDGIDGVANIVHFGYQEADHPGYSKKNSKKIGMTKRANFGGKYSRFLDQNFSFLCWYFL